MGEGVEQSARTIKHVLIKFNSRLDIADPETRITHTLLPLLYRVLKHKGTSDSITSHIHPIIFYS